MSLDRRPEIVIRWNRIEEPDPALPQPERKRISMRMSRQFIPTLREAPADADSVSERLLLRGGFIRRTGQGLYAMLPAGLRVMRRIERIIREEMERIGAQEMMMPMLLPLDLLDASGRVPLFADELFRFDDRAGRSHFLAPTHEEAFCAVAAADVRTSRTLPAILWQMQMKYRDERRPRLGLLRTREFLMQDAYSFDIDEAGLAATSARMSEAYAAVLDRIGLSWRRIEADTGVMGGIDSEEYIAVSPIGESQLRLCTVCGYGANVERAACAAPGRGPRNDDASPALPAIGSAGDVTGTGLQEEAGPMLADTPGIATVADLCGFFACKPDAIVKTLLLLADDLPVAALIRGDRELSEPKLRRALGCLRLSMADPETVRGATGAEVGFAGPIGLRVARIVADPEVLAMKQAIVGANRTGMHFVGVRPERDWKADLTADIRTLQHGDPCPRCGAPVEASTGIELGQSFQLGTHYSGRMQCVYADAAGAVVPMQMGAYGLGVGRMLATTVEQRHDDDGICWPLSIAPWHCVVIPVSPTDEAQEHAALEIHDRLEAAGVEVLIDDRPERAGVKFKDADLIGIPFRITAGRRLGDGLVEWKRRGDASAVEMTIGDTIARVVTAVEAERGRTCRMST